MRGVDVTVEYSSASLIKKGVVSFQNVLFCLCYQKITHFTSILKTCHSNSDITFSALEYDSKVRGSSLSPNPLLFHCCKSCDFCGAPQCFHNKIKVMVSFQNVLFWLCHQKITHFTSILTLTSPEVTSHSLHSNVTVK